MINRLRILHTHPTHNYLTTKEEPPMCETCGVLLTINHIVSESQKFESYRNQFPTKFDQTLGPNRQDITQISFLKKIRIILLNIIRIDVLYILNGQVIDVLYRSIKKNYFNEILLLL